MKVGTDGVLLGAWASLRPTDLRLLDIGTGTGLIALMLAQRAPGARITGIDIADTSQARENADASPWGERLSFVSCPVQCFEVSEPFDLIVSNPPFFDDSLLCPDAGRTAARHAVTLPFGELCAACGTLCRGAADLRGAAVSAGCGRTPYNDSSHRCAYDAAPSGQTYAAGADAHSDDRSDGGRRVRRIDRRHGRTRVLYGQIPGLDAGFLLEILTSRGKILHL